MKSNYFLILSLISLIISCGPSKEENKKREKFVADSLKIVREDSLARVAEQMETERIHLEKIEVGKSINKTKLSNILDEVKSQLLTAKRKLDRINEFQLGRSMSTKQQQLSDQQGKINELESFISNVEKEISLTNLFNSFDFQLTPEGTVEHIFSSAKNNDLTKMRHLLDPYGEYDVDAQQICLVEMFPSDGQNEWRKEFANGRIMGVPIIEGDKAEIEIAIGNSSNRLEKIKLVQRKDKWYVIGM